MRRSQLLLAVLLAPFVVLRAFAELLPALAVGLGFAMLMYLLVWMVGGSVPPLL